MENLGASIIYTATTTTGTTIDTSTTTKVLLPMNPQTQTVVTGDVQPPSYVTRGVPQGSIHGPLLFTDVLLLSSAEFPSFTCLLFVCFCDCVFF